MPVLPLDCHLPTQYTTHTITLQQWTNNKTNKSYKQLIYIYIYISHVNVTQTVPDISPLMPMHQYPLLVFIRDQNNRYLLSSIHVWVMDYKLENHHYNRLISVIFNSSPPNSTNMHQWIGSALIKIMACRLFGAKPLSEPIMGYCHLDP